MTAVKGQHLLVKGCRIHYYQADGSGEPLVLLHGSAIDSSALSFGPHLQTFSAFASVYAPDWPGYGKSEQPRERFSTSDYVRILEDFLDALELSRVNLLGFSMGGGAALGFALKHPERVHKLALVSSYGLGGEVHVPLLPYVALKMPRLDWGVWTGLRRSRRLLKLFLQAFVFANRRKVTRELVEEVFAQMRVPDIERAFMGWLRGEMRWNRLTTDYQHRFGELRTPTLLLHGTRDLIVPASRARRAAQGIRQARLVLIPKCGHWVPREAAERFQQEVRQFMGNEA